MQCDFQIQLSVIARCAGDDVKFAVRQFCTFAHPHHMIAIHTFGAQENIQALKVMALKRLVSFQRTRKCQKLCLWLFRSNWRYS